MIEFSEVTYSYSDVSPPAVSNLSLTIPDTGITAIMGANGSGKSTAALCMNGILIPRKGIVSVDGMATSRKEHLASIRNRVGIVFQNPNHQFTSLTVERELAFGLENLGMDEQEMKERVEEYLRAFLLEANRNTPPSSLSGGEKQRVALAAVAIMQPKYLILDEATSLLPPVGRRALLNDVEMLANRPGVAIVLVTQFPREALIADTLLVFGNGFLACSGKPFEILKDGSELRSIGVTSSFPVRYNTNAD